MSGIKGPPTANMRNFIKRLQAMPHTAAIEVARRGAPVITRLAQAAFDAGQNVYGSARPLGVNGNKLSLVQSGTARGGLLFTSDGGTKMRAVLAANYVRYLIGKYKILPIGNASMPIRWQLSLNTLAAEVIARSLGIAPAQLRKAA